jgi:predicted house-cleaning noncanonical NTP pyrophosphatase (MazG superfamily)
MALPNGPGKLLASWRSADLPDLAIPAVAGAKAGGLVALPGTWVPPFMVFGARFAELQRSAGSAAKAWLRMSETDKALLSTFLGRLQRADRRTMVRSNSPTEGMDSAGQFSSKPVAATTELVLDAIDAVTLGGSHPSAYALLQECLEPSISGHMSNERRVSKQRSSWTIEGPDPIGLQRIRVTAGEYVDEALTAVTASQVVVALKRVAIALTGRPLRYHVEWVWTGERVWVVQVSEVTDSSSSEFNTYLQSVDRDVEMPMAASGPQLEQFLQVGRGRWKKLERPFVFADLGLPVGEVYLLSGDQFARLRAAHPQRLESMLSALCSRPVVIRCDVSADHASPDILLPTSPPSSIPDFLIDWMQEQAFAFASSGIPTDQFAFLPANLIRSRASALVSAKPGHRQVLIDSLWGWPDGLNFLPHDGYRVDLATSRVIATTRYKGLALDAFSEWKTVPVGAPFDWRRVLSDEEAVAIAAWARAIADHLNRDLQLMVLARIGGHRGPQACLPWHYWTDTPPLLQRQRRGRTILPSGPMVRNLEDLADIRFPMSRLNGLFLRPNPPYTRSVDFLEKVAETAKRMGVPIYFEGSILGHAYYVMASAGATVIPIGEPTRTEPPHRYGKLVRDRIPAVIQEAGGVARVRTLRRDEASILLSQKLVEESLEAWNASPPNLPEELADVLEVVDAIRETAGIEASVLDAIKARKRNERGGFRELVYLEETAVRPLDFLSGDSSVRTDGAHRSRYRSDRISVSGQIARGSATIKLPLVPPVENGHRVNVIKGSLAESDFEVAYSGADLVITFGSAPPPSAGDQLSLLSLIDE